MATAQGTTPSSLDMASSATVHWGMSLAPLLTISPTCVTKTMFSCRTFRQIHSVWAWNWFGCDSLYLCVSGNITTVNGPAAGCVQPKAGTISNQHN